MHKRNNAYTCMNKAIALLSRREYSQKELYQKLLSYNYSEEEIQKTICILQSKNLQSDERFAQSQARKYQNKGQSKLSYILKQHNLSEENLSLAILTQKDRGSELERANLAWHKKFANNINKFSQKIQQEETEYKKTYQKQMRFMLSQGFTYEICRKVIKE